MPLEPNESDHFRFGSETPDEAEELQALAKAIRMSAGFSLLIARCNHPKTRDRLVAELRDVVSDLSPVTIDLPHDIVHVLRYVRERIDKAHPSPLMINGIEKGLTPGRPSESPVLANLNASRDSFASLKAPIAFWLSDYAISAMSAGAPDFFSVRSGVFHFKGAIGDREVRIAELFSALRHFAFGYSQNRQARQLPKDRQIIRLQQIENLLAVVPHGLNANELSGTRPAYARYTIEKTEMLIALGDLNAAMITARSLYTDAVAAGYIGSALSAVVQLAECLFLLRRYDEIDSLYETVLQLPEIQGNLSWAIAVQIPYLALLGQMGRLSEFDDLLQDLLTKLPAVRDVNFASEHFIYLAEAVSCIRTDRLTRAIQYTQMASDIAENTLGRPEANALSDWVMGDSLYYLGQPNEAVPYYVDALAYYGNTGLSTEISALKAALEECL